MSGNLIFVLCAMAICAVLGAVYNIGITIALVGCILLLITEAREKR